MKSSKDKKELIKTEDDTLYGLLSSYKIYNTYFRILINEEENKLILQLTDNPKKWPKSDNEDFKGFSLLNRSDIKLVKMSVKYLSPEHVLDQFGPVLGVKAPAEEIIIANNLKKEGYYSITADSEYLNEITANINKIIDLTPKKKLEIMEHLLLKEEE